MYSMCTFRYSFTDGVHSRVDLKTLNMDSDPEFCPNLDADPREVSSILREKMVKIVLEEKNSFKNIVFKNYRKKC